jgi:hypothetical protein
MEFSEKQRAVSRIISGVSIVNFSGKQYIVKEADRLSKYIAEDIYEKTFSEAVSKEILTEKQSLEYLKSLGSWSDEEEKEFESLPKRLSNAKLQLYSSYKSFRNTEPVRKTIAKLKQTFYDLAEKRNILRANSAEGIAEASKFRYLICANVTDYNGNRIWNSDDYGAQNETLVNTLINNYLFFQPNESEIRELCRNEPWRSLWSCGKSESGVFGKPSADLTQVQRGMISWSKIYDSINESPESPADSVIEDDDMLDGYLAFQHEKREKMKDQKNVSEASSGVRGDEVYLMAGTEKDASRIYSMNDSNSKAIIRTRQKQIDKAKKGLPAEKTFDAQMDMRQQSMQSFKDKVK